MGVEIKEGELVFEFPDGWSAEKYDEIGYYQKHLTGFAGNCKAVDIVAFDPDGDSLWLVEVKDYRTHRRQKSIDLLEEIALKVRDTLAGMMVMRVRAGGEVQHLMEAALRAPRRLRVVLHLEQPAKPSKLFPWILDPKSAKDKLRSEIWPVDAHPIVSRMGSLGMVTWRVSGPS